MAEKAKEETRQEEKMVKVKFQHAENPSKDVEFYVDGKKYALKDGEEARLPVSVVRHLNSLKYPIYDFVDDGSGKMVNKQVGERNRFNCIQLELI
ncbi:MAG: hypothetical protein RBQ86_05675 [Candidatus Izemoplasmatales bacterium]|jgi:hypothetical protein|nr:hypothetical protein [Candidatus Izemoplasmatales bacterium]